MMRQVEGESFHVGEGAEVERWVGGSGNERGDRWGCWAKSAKKERQRCDASTHLWYPRSDPLRQQEHCPPTKRQRH
jgi:hypothetical protein